MKYSENYQMFQPEASDFVNAEHISRNAEIADKEIHEISEIISGALRPKGTIAFSELSNLETTAKEGDMYNISDEFVTTAECPTFREGAGHTIPAGSNVYRTADGVWDVLAGSPVAGVKGVNETSFRTGNVILTPDNLGLTASTALSGYDYDTDAIEISAKERGGYDAIEIAKFHEKVFRGIAEGITKIKETAKGAVHRYGSHNGSVGYAKIAHITITGTYIDKPIALKIATRDGAMSELHIMFSGDAHTDPNVKYFTISGINSAFLVRTAAGEWDLFIYNRAWQDIDVVDFKYSYYLAGKVKLAWTKEFETTVPSGFVAATRIDSVLNTVEACEASTNSFDLAGAAAVKELNGRFATGTVSVDVINGFGTFSIDYTFESAPFIIAQPIGAVIGGNVTVSVVPASVGASEAIFRITFSNAANATVNIQWFAFGN